METLPACSPPSPVAPHLLRACLRSQPAAAAPPSRRSRCARLAALTRARFLAAVPRSSLSRCTLAVRCMPRHRAHRPSSRARRSRARPAGRATSRSPSPSESARAAEASAVSTTLLALFPLTSSPFHSHPSCALPSCHHLAPPGRFARTATNDTKPTAPRTTRRSPLRPPLPRASSARRAPRWGSRRRARRRASTRRKASASRTRPRSGRQRKASGGKRTKADGDREGDVGQA